MNAKLSLRTFAWSLVTLTLLAGSAWAADCQIVGQIQKQSKSVSFTSNRTTSLRLTVPNRGTVSPSRIEAVRGRRYTVAISGYPVKIKDMTGSPTGCNDQTIQ